MDAQLGRQRDQALRSSGILDGAASLGLDKLVRLARFVAGSRFAAIHLLDARLQHRIAEDGGVPLGQSEATDSMCLPVIESGIAYYAADASLDPLYAGSANTSGPTPVRMFAATPFRDQTGVVIGTLCVFDHDRIELDARRLALLSDLADHVRQHLELHGRVRELAHAAAHDSLTGLANRTLLSERLARAMTKRRRGPGEPALAMIDLDGFKAVNDRFGHQAGDEVLIEVGRRLVAAARAEDTVARLGGDEFVVLYDQLPSDADGAAAAFQARLRTALQVPLEVAGQSLVVRAAIGFVQSHPAELGYELLGRADAAMYENKKLR